MALLTGYSTGDDNFDQGPTIRAFAQQFNLTLDSVVTSVKVKISRLDPPTNAAIYMYIFPTTGGSPPRINPYNWDANQALASASVLDTDIPYNPTFGWVEFTLASPLSLSGSTTYAIGFLFGNRFCWAIDSTLASYIGGEAVFNSGDELAYFHDSLGGVTNDFMFEIHGTDVYTGDITGYWVLVGGKLAPAWRDPFDNTEKIGHCEITGVSRRIYPVCDDSIGGHEKDITGLCILDGGDLRPRITV